MIDFKGRHVSAVSLAIAAMAGLAACAPSPPPAPPPERAAAVETLVAANVDEVWDTLLAELPRRSLVINSPARSDRRITVIFQSTTPSEYVDCGEIDVTTKLPQFGEQKYNFLAANSARYLVGVAGVEELVDVERQTSLTGLANIELAPASGGTLVRVNARYVMSFKTREFGRNVQLDGHTSSLNFRTAGSARQQERIREGARSKTVTIECRPTGELERRIVSALPAATGASPDDGHRAIEARR